KDGWTIIWQGTERPSQQLVMVGGRGGRWVSCQFSAKTCLRYDDGMLLRRLNAGQIIPVRPSPTDAEPPRFELDPGPNTLGKIILEDGLVRQFDFTLRNFGGRAFGVRLRAINLDDSSTGVVIAQTIGSRQEPRSDRSGFSTPSSVSSFDDTIVTVDRG